MFQSYLGIDMTPDLKTDEQFIQLLTTQYGWEITGPTHHSTPEPKLDYIGRNQREFELLTHYVTRTYIIRDPFDTDHRSRHIFLTDLETKNPCLREWIKMHSKLKKNRIITDVIHPMELIREDFVEPIVSRVAGICASLYEPIGRYDTSSFEEKVTFVHTVDGTVLQFLEVLSK